MATNKVVRLAQRPKGPVKNEDFEIVDEAIPEPGDGEIRVKTSFISLDPAMRGWMNEGQAPTSHRSALAMSCAATTAGHVEASRHPDFKEGDTP